MAENKIVAPAVIAGVVATVLQAAAADPSKSLEHKDVRPITAAVATEVAKEVDARVRMATNTEAHWYQKRTVWAAIVSAGLTVAGPLLVRYGITVDDATKDFVTEIFTTVGGLWTMYLALRAGYAAKPLGT